MNERNQLQPIHPRQVEIGDDEVKSIIDRPANSFKTVRSLQALQIRML